LSILLPIYALRHVVLVPTVGGREYFLECPSSKIKSISVAMSLWSVDHRAFDLKNIFKNNDSVIVTHRIFRRHFNIHQNDSVPSCNTVLLWVRNFIEISSVAKRKPPKRMISLKTPEDIERVRQAYVTSPQRSASRNTIAVRMSDSTVRQILHEELNFLPHKMVMCEAINDQDTVYRKILCEVRLNALDNDDLKPVLMTGEANFHLCGNVNSQNCQYCTTRNPRNNHQKTLHSKKVIVWCGVASFGVMGPYFLEDDAGRAVKLNSARHSEMLRTFPEQVLQRLGVETQTFRFQHDGATVHTARTAMRVLYEMFRPRVISLTGNMEWPAR
jgi:hypothetical protein